MAPSLSRHLLVWTTLPIAIILSYLWFRRKREAEEEVVPSDPGKHTSDTPAKTLKEELDEAATQTPSNKSTTSKSSPQRFARSLSSPIDIILPPELKSQKSSQLIISDEDLDLEIQKVRSMKTSASDQYLLRRKDTQSTSPPPTQTTSSSSPLRAAKNDDDEDNNSSSSTTPINDSLMLQSVVQPVQLHPLPSPKKAAAACGGSGTTPKSQKTPTRKGGNMQPMEAMPDARVTVAAIEKKIGSLTLTENVGSNSSSTSSCCSSGASVPPAKPPTKMEAVIVHADAARPSSERDSANHSPADVMLASPSLSSISDTHSEGSNDSGKGCSELATPPLRTSGGGGSAVGGGDGDGSVTSEPNSPSIYEFVIPQLLVGRLIGRHGSFVTYVNNKTHANIIIKRHPESSKFKICAIEGAPSEIDKALQLIRDKFPAKQYPEVNLEQVSFAPPISTVSLAPELLCLKLVEGINNDTIVSCMVAPNHLFLQQPAHPTFPNLNFLSSFMNSCYSDTITSPPLPNPIPPNTVCAAYSLGAWYRAIVLSTNTETDTSYVKFLDYGGYANTPNSDLRQIRADFLLLPFQASECLLANVRPIGGDENTWSEEAFTLVADLTKGSVVYTQVAEFTEDGIPLVLIYVVVGPQQIIYLNGELVSRGYAEWISSEEEGAVGGAPATVTTA